MLNSESHLIFVNQEPYQVWSRASSFQNDDFLRGFDPGYHLRVARLLEPGLGGESSDPASLGMRTLHGLASEAFFAFLFALIQAPDAPAAWFLLYRPGDLEQLLRKLEAGESFPGRLRLAANSWQSIAESLIPISEDDFAEAEATVKSFGEFWGRLAADFQSDAAKKEFNSLKHGLRACAASPYFEIGGYQVPMAEQGSSFPVLNRQGNEVVLSIGFRNWSARSLLAQLELIAASITNLLALFKKLHGIEEHLELEIPSADVFESSKLPRDQLISSVTLSTSWPGRARVRPVDRARALAVYQGLGELRIGRR